MISFKQFLREKAMNPREFKKVAARQGGNAKVGFEFEMIVPEGSPVLADSEMSRDYVALNTIDDLSELREYFKIDLDKRKKLSNEYEAWVEGKDGDGTGATDFSSFIDSEYGSLYKFVSAHALRPAYGWEGDTGNDSARVYSHDTDDEDLQKETFSNIEIELGDYLGTNVTTAWRGADEHYRRGDWLVVPDSSIEVGDHGGVGAEVNSPPQSLSKALEDLKKMFEWMKTNNIQTNDSTGLHINISMPGIENVDLVKLVLFMGDKHVLRQFHRLGNTYTKPQSQAIINNVAGKGRLPRDADSMIKIARDALSTQKYSSVHIEKLKNGYLEFRVAGDSDYQHKFDLIRDTVLRFVAALELAVNPEAERKEYLKKLAKILAVGETSDQNHDLDDRPLTDILEFADFTATAQGIDLWLAKAKAEKIDEASSARAKKWIEVALLRDLTAAFKVLQTDPTPKHRAEFKLFVKKLGVNFADLRSNTPWTTEAFGLTK